MSLRLYREQPLQYARQPLRTKCSRYGGSIGRYGGRTGRYRGSTGRYGRRSIRRSSKDSRKEFEGVLDRILSEQPISRIIDIRGTVKLLGKGKLEFNRYLRLQHLLYSYLVIYSESPTTPHRHPSVSLTLLYCDPSCCPLTVPTVTPTQDYTQLTQSPTKEAIRQARDLIIKALSLTKSYKEQSRLLDLIEVFREYIEKGRLYKALNIIATQVANLELATRKIETKARDLAKEPKPKEPSFAIVAAQGSRTKGTQEQTLVDKTKAKAQGATKPKPRESNSIKSRRLVLICSTEKKDLPFSAVAIRNTLNKAFRDKGVLELVVAIVTRSLSQNLVITTTTSFTADFLLEKKATQGSVIPGIEELQKDKPQSKVVLYRIPIADFNTPEGIDLAKEEIQIFNKGLKPIGTPYQLTSASKRQSQLAGSLVVSFATEAKASRAIRQRVYIGGISARVEKHYTMALNIQCSRY